MNIKIRLLAEFAFFCLQIVCFATIRSENMDCRKKIREKLPVHSLRNKYESACSQLFFENCRQINVKPLLCLHLVLISLQKLPDMMKKGI